MKKVALALFFVLVGCGDDFTNYDVRIGALDPPSCMGYMQIVGKGGYWRCEFIGGEAHLDLSTPGTVFLNLETTPGAFSQVRGTFVEGGGITGQIFLDGDAVSFFATRQQQ